MKLRTKYKILKRKYEELINMPVKATIQIQNTRPVTLRCSKAVIDPDPYGFSDAIKEQLRYDLINEANNRGVIRYRYEGVTHIGNLPLFKYSAEMTVVIPEH